MENKELKERFIDEKTGIEYRLVGDYYIPNITIPKARRTGNIGKYGKGQKGGQKPCVPQRQPEGGGLHGGPRKQQYVKDQDGQHYGIDNFFHSTIYEGIQ